MTAVIHQLITKYTLNRGGIRISFNFSTCTQRLINTWHTDSNRAGKLVQVS